MRLTGKPLYKPETGRAPANLVRSRSSSAGGSSVYDSLYNLAHEWQAKKDAVKQMEKAEAVAATRVEVKNNVSQRLFSSLKQRRFTQIFEYLDEAGAGTTHRRCS